MDRFWSPRRRRLVERSAIMAGVALAHGVLLVLIGQVRPGEVPAVPPLINVELVRPEVVEPPPPPVPPARTAGGGAPAAPSRVRPPLTPPTTPPEIIAPPTPAPEQPLVVGTSSDPVPEAGPGRGQQGTGSGTGSGPGSGAGAGSSPPRLITGPSIAQIRASHPPEALRRGRSGRGEIRCRIRLDTRLEGCVVVSESPAGQGFGQAALQVSSYFRFQPPVEDGAPQAGESVTFGVDFGRPR